MTVLCNHILSGLKDYAAICSFLELDEMGAGVKVLQSKKCELQMKGQLELK